MAIQELNPGDVTVLGAPSDAHSSYRRGAAKAPARIRRLLQVGIPAMTPHQLEQAERFGVEVDRGANLGSE